MSDNDRDVAVPDLGIEGAETRIGRPWVACLAVFSAGLLAYLTSFQGSFLFDDLVYIASPDVQKL
ncbi:MAG TPA: hypothetical protein VFV34_01830, partial [Blastocatellia bacterium]|nr:hypothetical protein [Blastocatellia bacterium]